MVGDGLSESREGKVEVGPGVFDEGRGNECSAIEVGQHPFRAALGAVDADDPEVLGAGGLDSWVQGAVGFMDPEVASAFAVMPVCECPMSHR